MLNVSLNLAGVAFAISAIVLYSINIAEIYLEWICEDYYPYSYKTTPSPRRELIMEKCQDGVNLALVSVKNVI